MSDEQDSYLQDNFDPNKIIVSKLRGILNKHGIDYSSAPRKAQLVELFNNEIVPRRAEYRAQLLEIAPSDSRIEDAPVTATRRRIPNNAGSSLPRADADSIVNTSSRPTEFSIEHKNNAPVSSVSSSKLAAAEYTEAVHAAMPASPRRRKLARAPDLTTPTTLSTSNLDNVTVTAGPRTRTRSRSPVRKIDNEPGRSPRRRRIAENLKTELKFDTTEESTKPQKSEIPSDPLPSHAEENEEEGNSSFTQENIFQNTPVRAKKRTSAVLDKEEERPNKVPALPAKADSMSHDDVHHEAASSTYIPSLSDSIPELLPAAMDLLSQTHGDRDDLNGIQTFDDIDIVEQYTNFTEDGTDSELPTGNQSVKDNEKTHERTIRSSLSTNFISNESTIESQDELLAGANDSQTLSVGHLSGMIPDLSTIKASNKFAEQLNDVATPSETDIEVTQDASETQEVVEPAALVAEVVEIEVLEDGANEVKLWPVVLSAVYALLRFLTLLAFVYCFVWWRQEKLNLDICGTIPDYNPYPEILTVPVSDTNLERLQEVGRDIIDIVGPQCSPCPEHAICTEGNIQCNNGYVIQENPFHFAGVFPLYPRFYCARNLEWDRKLQHLAERAMWILHERRAQVECGQSDEPIAITENDLRQELYAYKSPQLDDQEFEELWQQVISSMAQNPEIEIERQVKTIPFIEHQLTKKSHTGIYEAQHPGSEHPQPQTVFVSHSLRNMSPVCRLRRRYVWFDNLYSFWLK